MEAIQHIYYNIDNVIERFEAPAPAQFQAYQSGILINGSDSTNFVYTINGTLSRAEIDFVNTASSFYDKFQQLNSLGCSLVFDRVSSSIFKGNLQIVDSYFDRMMAKMLLLYYAIHKSVLLKLLDVYRRKTF
jgi:hypothetical protein